MNSVKQDVECKKYAREYVLQFQTIKVSQGKLVLIKKEMASIHERTFKLKVSCYLQYCTQWFNSILLLI